MATVGPEPAAATGMAVSPSQSAAGRIGVTRTITALLSVRILRVYPGWNAHPGGAYGAVYAPAHHYVSSRRPGLSRPGCAARRREMSGS